MLTTDGSSCLASCENAVDNWTGFGITSGVAPGAGVSLAAFTPVLIRVPIRIPIDNVNKIKVEETSFFVRIVFRKLISIPIPPPQLYSLIISNGLTRWMLLKANWFQFCYQDPNQDQDRAENGPLGQCF